MRAPAMIPRDLVQGPTEQPNKSDRGYGKSEQSVGRPSRGRPADGSERDAPEDLRVTQPLFLGEPQALDEP